jgi:hypothetical protein
MLLMGSAFTAIGEPQVGALISIIQAVSIIIGIAGGYFVLGTWGVLWGVALHKFVPGAAILVAGRRRKWVDFRKELRILPAFGAGILCGEAFQFMLKSSISH